ncbi:hypothetical protein [Methylobacterium sp. Leaf117]|uniref:hypothetical protein n=1 Tax=Methylobacterium sp. Leaf117 TaxID=1736260 RepID=UPI000AC96AA4
MRDGVRVFSSNDTLYGDLGARRKAVYRDFAPSVFGRRSPRHRTPLAERPTAHACA